ncbi:uncharacterized protein LOC129697394 isoform X2 [Leucoraja erinacea]|uniref:uncharacterized protein LOC129697394 isoform X2 n=1 Tax=Leucoraja erinaceus TaxID=7782 RepID=UPI00245789D0|nr:uncharacterized protein LOC129697394 isoform X2 [Leucoraja erinacea]
MYLDQTGRGKWNFRRVAGIVKTICGMNLVLKRYLHKDKVIRWAAHHRTRKSDIDKELLFNIHNFTKNKNESDSAKLKSLLSVLPHERTTHGISLAQTLLHNNQAFQCMPHIVQLEICQAAVYQRYEAKTTVIRKGHQPEGCYFVVTGKLTAKSNDASSIVQNSITEVLNEIEEGDLFGDAVLLTNTKRPTTVLCKTTAELLLINKEDFESILARTLEQRYSVITELLGSHPIFASWTIEKLTLLSHSSLLRYYRSGTAVVPESCNSAFIVIVKSGRCHIVTNLRMDHHGKDQTQRLRSIKSTMPLKELSMLTSLEKETKSTGKSLQRTTASPSFATAGSQEAMKTHKIKESRSTDMASPTHSLLQENSTMELEHTGLEEQLSISASASERDMSREQSVSFTPISINHIPEDTNKGLEDLEPCKEECLDESPSFRFVQSTPQITITTVEEGIETQEATKPSGNNEDQEQNKERKKVRS